MSTTLSAPELFAVSQGQKNSGTDRCHWCGCQCKTIFQHDDTVLVTGRSRSGAKFPQGRFVCEGCRLYRRDSCTVFFLDDTYKDRQSLRFHSWWMTDEGLRCVRKEDRPKLYGYLLEPPPLFCLSLLSEENGKPAAATNQIHLCHVNDLPEVQAETPLKFTIDGVAHEYTVYELREALKHKMTEGKMPGVRALVQTLGWVDLPGIDVETKRGRGRPPKDAFDKTDRVVSKK